MKIWWCLLIHFNLLLQTYIWYLVLFNWTLTHTQQTHTHSQTQIRIMQMQIETERNQKINTCYVLNERKSAKKTEQVKILGIYWVGITKRQNLIIMLVVVYMKLKKQTKQKSNSHNNRKLEIILLKTQKTHITDVSVRLRDIWNLIVTLLVPPPFLTFDKFEILWLVPYVNT